INEKLTYKYSDEIIVLNEREKKELIKIYGDQYKNKINIIPLTLEDKFTEYNEIEDLKKFDYLFVGSDFYANINGLRWFCKNVMPYVSGKLKVIGKGMEKYKLELENEKIEIIGTVESIEEYYYSALCVVAPIFEGAGMKTKITEALMFGKKIFGTKEAFEGFDINVEIGEVCNTREEFIKSLNNENYTNYNIFSRNLYLEKYSDYKKQIYLKNIFRKDTN
ncbi:MAG: glycosyltransferase, partial [Cetobacterium sp.]